MTGIDSEDTSGIPQSALPFVGIFFISLYALVVGAMLGVLSFFVARYIWLLFLFPVIIGFLGAGLYSQLIRKYRIRSTWLVVLIGLLMSLLIYFTRHYLDYLETIRLVNAEGLSFWQYMRLNALVGFSFGRSDTELSGIFVWLYWLFEVAMTGGIIVFMASDVTRQPFCEKCKDWYSGGTLLGSVAPEDMPVFGTALRQGNYQQASGLIEPDYNGPVRLDVYIRRCNNEAHDLILQVDQIETSNNKIKKTEFWKAPISSIYAQTFNLS